MTKYAISTMMCALMLVAGPEAAQAQRGGSGGGGGNHGGGSHGGGNHGGGSHGGGNHGGGGNWGGGNWGGGHNGGGWGNGGWGNGGWGYNNNCYNNGYYTNGYYNTAYTTSPVIVSQPVRVVSQPATLLRTTSVSSTTDRADDLIAQLYPAANQLGLDMHYNYQHNSNWADTYRLTFALVETAKVLQANDYRGDQASVSRRIQEMDQLVQEVRLAVRGWTRRDVRTFGTSGLSDKLETVDRMIVDLMQELGVRPVPAATQFEEAPAPPAR